MHVASGDRPNAGGYDQVAGEVSDLRPLTSWVAGEARIDGEEPPSFSLDATIPSGVAGVSLRLQRSMFCRAWSA
jgi:hypothetical protein